MLILLVVGFVAGIITSLSPCILPVLPVVLAASNPSLAKLDQWQNDSTDGATNLATTKTRSWRPYGVVTGLVIGFTLTTLFGSLLLSALRLPLDLLRNIGIAVLLIIGVSFIWPPLAEFLERPFAKLPGRQVNPDGNGIILGLGLGLLFVPCAGPVLAVIAVVGASQHFSAGAALLTVGFGLGVGVPLLGLALAGESITRRIRLLRRNAQRLRTAGGVVMIVMAVLIGFNLTDGLQRLVPGYADQLERAATQNASEQLTHLAANGGLQVNKHGEPGCSEGNTSLVDCGSAPEPTGIAAWLNTPDGAPVTLAQLRGKVVLVDFWTYSCINCQRTLPHLESWYRAYRDVGFEIIGVHTPEFAFEHDPANVKAQAAALGVPYPIAIDNDFATWRKYNATWPSEFLVDKAGNIRHVSWAEGHYDAAESLIRQLLTEANPGQTLPPATEVPDVTPTEPDTLETYLGQQHAPLHASGQQPESPTPTTYTFPTTVEPNTFALAGTWSAGEQSLSAGAGAQLTLNARAKKVHLVAGGHGKIMVNVNGTPGAAVNVDGAPTLYTLTEQNQVGPITVSLSVEPGVDAYSFTFD